MTLPTNDTSPTDSVCAAVERQPARIPVSIIIPAHNEESVIGRCLKALLDGAEPGELEVIVACNGCHDRTEEIARSFGPDVRVVESAIQSKVAALNTGDAAATRFPRLYVDADIVLSLDAVRRTAAVLHNNAVLAAAPHVEWDLRKCGWLVRAFYAVWRHQPYFDSGRLGSGVYALSEAGHARLNSFPNLTGDDEYVRRLFAPEERANVPGCSFTVVPPRNIRDLVRIKTRSRRGNLEIARFCPNLPEQPTGGTSRFARRILARPWLWPAAVVYFTVVALTKWHAHRTCRRGVNVLWERDLSSRIPTSHTTSGPQPLAKGG